MDEHLSALVHILDKQHIRYFLLTDFEADFDARDVDLYVHPDCQYDFEQILQQTGWFLRKEPPHHFNHHFYYSPDLAVFLDVKYGLTFAKAKDKCCTYLAADSAMGRVIRNGKGVYRPSGLDALLLYAAHLAFKERGKLEEKHRNYLTFYLKTYQHEVSPQDNKLLEDLHDWALHFFPDGVDELQRLLRPYFEQQHLRMVRKKPRFNYGFGLKILFIGTDGAGKTTLIEAVGKKINLKTRKLYLGMGENGWTSPLTKRLYQAKVSRKPFSKLLNLFRNLVVLPAEFMLRILPVQLKAKYAIVLIDRFPGSILLRNSRLTQLYRAILPKPDLVFFLYADPEVLVNRKPNESTLERSKKEVIKFRKVAETVSAGHYIPIDTASLTIAEARDQIISEIYKNAKVHAALLTSPLP
ncbi:hypothetical protein MKJ04_04645 [Pontibacter sp. E15-1]|uniref:hypothetical protein n=1 Tax=Pontibacter sp. E15-1 TaxID=2919918 RepID=UPI001F4FE145|nr:hypothetical protein [Pontibacter sp. E15-1]MCJ8164119.1 hypothetical protein [Pontibacter sp. E15-1]